SRCIRREPDAPYLLLPGKHVAAGIPATDVATEQQHPNSIDTGPGQCPQRIELRKNLPRSEASSLEYVTYVASLELLDRQTIFVFCVSCATVGRLLANVSIATSPRSRIRSSFGLPH